jgi:threonine dehydrogenase-like Zn-dependent dehydrogenase
MSKPAVRAVVQTGARQLEMREFPWPDVGEDAAVLRVEACGICGSDVEQYRGNLERLGMVRYPFVPGHEPLGVIAEIGTSAAERWGVGVGDRVAVEPVIPCGHCEACLRGMRTTCTGWGRMMSYGFVEVDVEPALWGGYADYMYLHPNSVLHPMSADLPAEIAVMFNPLGAGVRWGAEAPGTGLGDTVVIFGAGQRGLACVVAARAVGAGQIIVTDVSSASEKLELAQTLGADAVLRADVDDIVASIDSLTGGRLADVVVDVSTMASQPLLDALDVVRPGGTVIVAGVKGGKAIPGFVSDKLILKSITMRGVFSVETKAYVQAIRLIESGRFPLESIHSGTFPLTHAEHALQLLGGEVPGSSAIHLALTPERPTEAVS